MPVKQAAKERTWGSRYDTLKSYPSSPSNQTSPVATTTATPQSPIAIQTDGTARTDDDRPANVAQSPVVADSKPEADKPSNDNSIFVGSLPTNIEPAELSRMLTQHLAEYPQIKDVKAIRDGKGGVCAFLACENAVSASQLLKDLHESPPQLFHNRTLRFEFARASRALLISYRTPMRLAYPNSGLESPREQAALGMDTPSDMPTALRIVRPRNAKFPAVLYDNEAINYSIKDVLDSTTPQEDTTVSGDVLSGVGVLIEPLRYDAQTLQKVASVFGPIESFGPFVPNREGDASVEHGKALRPFADIARSPGMEGGVWEVKWARRDDSVLANMILRRIPHLSVMWTHHWNNDGGPDSRYGSPSTSPGPLHPSMSRVRHLSRTYVNGPDYQDHFSPFPSHMTPSASNLRLTTSPYNEGSVSPQFNRWSPVYSANHIRGPSSPLVQREERAGFPSPSVSGQGFNDADFPPLHGPSRFRNLTRPPSLPWIPRDIEQHHSTGVDREKGATLSPSPSSSLSVQPSTPGVTRSTPSPPVTESQDALASRLSSSPTVVDTVGEADPGQEITVPPTPEFTAASITPVTPKTGTSYPVTPQSATAMDYVGHSDHYNTTPRKAGRFGSASVVGRDDADVHREFDPCSVFVGNLDTNDEWSEDRLRGIFEKYGRLEEVSFHVPFAKTVGFAFLKFADAESSARAITGENTRRYNGRPMRVQIREMKPPSQRTPLKGPRGRGRPRMYGDSPRHLPSPGGLEFNDRSNDDGQGYGNGPSPVHPPYRTEPRYTTQNGRDAPPHFSRSHHATDSTASGQPIMGRSGEMKVQSPPVDVHPAGSWRPSTGTFHTDNHSERATITSSATSVSVSPPPSSSGSHSASTVGYATPYPMMMNPWMPYHPYHYSLQYMGAPYMGYPHPSMAPYPQPTTDGATLDTSASHQQAWDAQNHMHKPVGYPVAPAPADQNMSSMYTGSGSGAEVQPPVRAVAFEQTDTGMFVPMYPPDALSQYMSAHSQIPSHGQTPPPQAPSAHSHPQQQHPHPSTMYMPHHPVPHMPMYAYPYGPPAAFASPPTQPAATPGGQHQATTGWSAPAVSNPLPTTPSTYLQPVPSAYLAPSQPSAPLNSSVSFSGHYAGTGPASGDQQFNGHRGQVPPRRGNNRMQGYNNKTVSHRSSPNRFQRQDGQMSASHSFGEGLSLARSYQPGPAAMRPFPNPHAQQGAGV